ncbi:MAG: PAS domain S-box protein [Elusimicrobia bacterium]|nr:PAS domain S-box protein [Elusimicrobiota bacterium]
MKLFYKLFWIILSLAILPLVLIAVWLHHYQDIAKSNALQLHSQLTDNVASAIEQHFSHLNKRLAFVRDLERASSIGDVEILKVIQTTLNANSDFLLICYLEAEGRERIKLGDQKFFPEAGLTSRASEPIVQQVKKEKRPHMSALESREGIPLVRIVYPLKNGDLAYLAVSLQELWKRVSTQKPGASGRFVLMDPEGQLLPIFAQDFPGWEPAQILKLLRSPSGTFESLVQGDKNWAGAFRTLPSPPWVAMTLQPQEEAFLASRKLTAGLLFWISLVALTALGVSFLIAQKITRPISSLHQAAFRIAENNYAQPVSEEGWREFRFLSRSFNEMMRQLKTYSELQVDRLIEEKTKVETLIYTIPEGIIMTTVKGEVLYINAPAMNMLGIRHKEGTQLKGKVQELTKNEDLRQSLQRIFSRRAKTEELELQFADPYGRRMKYFKTTATLVSTPAAQEVAVVLVMRDITAEKEIDRMKEEFFQSITHDLRAPLFAIQGYVRLLQKSLSPGAKEKVYFQSIYRSCEKLTLLIQDILDLARLEAGRVKPSPTNIEPVPFLEKIVELFSSIAQEKEIQLQLQLPSQDSGVLQADERLLERVFSNLISNALKFTPAKGLVRVHLLEATLENLRFAVEDSGPGIPKDQLQSVFEKFKQLDVTHQKTGFGLGLTICKRIMELHHGRIWVESELGHGSRFIFELPRKQTVLVE